MEVTSIAYGELGSSENNECAIFHPFMEARFLNVEKWPLHKSDKGPVWENHRQLVGEDRWNKFGVISSCSSGSVLIFVL